MTTFLAQKRGLCEKISILVKTFHFDRTKLSFDDFLMTTSWWENESERKKEPKIPCLRFCTECLCKEPGKITVGRKRLQSSSSSTKEPPTGFKDCGKRLAERDDGLGFSNGQSASTQQVILNHILWVSKHHWPIGKTNDYHNLMGQRMVF